MHSARRRRRWPWLLLIPLVVVAFLGWSVVGALTTPGNEGFSAKWADWLRGHHAAFAVNHVEALYYNHEAPAKGGTPTALNALPPAGPVTTPATDPTNSAQPPVSVTSPASSTASSTPPTIASSTPPTAAPGPGALPAPRAIPSVVSAAVPGEGQWAAVGPLVNGHVAMYEAQFRADNVYTREITSAVWIDPLLMHLALIPGLTEPGGTWPHPPYVTTSERSTIAAAFNGGFRFQDAKGGFELDGRIAVPLRVGAASFVIYRSGRVDIGAWGSEITPSPAIVAVLQNLVPMVDHGQVSAAATYNDNSVWGDTLGAQVVVARSGIGVTTNGALIYVAGPALTARTLAESLQRAGAIRAMTLDINPAWVTYNFFSHPNPTDPSQIEATKLYPQMERPASRYLGPTEESRDFITVSAP